ncbi:MAG: hypothetical protein HOO88_06575 [Kiritimatiellaceae bacterium]|nr:hypothetical protein [Kiritimatiellaceae bacterium]
MKKVLFSGLLLVSAMAFGIEKGASRTAVLAELGEPNGSMRRDGKEILLFKTGTVTLQNDIVTGINLSQEYARKTEERALKAKEIRAAERVELEKQKQLYPEDHVIQTGCAYSKTENWEALPESIRPAHGKYAYDVYLPPGYHGSDRHYTCLFLEAPALWDSVKERVRKEKWIVVILPDVAQEQMGKTINGNFLAAFDDVTARFRIAKDRIFTAGKIPAALFTTMRPVAGIILQDPDFRGIERAGFNPDFLRKNPDLRAYVLLGNSDRDNVSYQAQFIVSQIPKYHIEVYLDENPVLPPALADGAIDWIKKEYNLP